MSFLNVLRHYYFLAKTRIAKNKKQKSVFSWKHLDDQNLYLDNDYALTEIGNSRYEECKTKFHSYWYGDIGRKQVFSIKSFLCTQNLEKVELNLWLDVESGYSTHRNNEYLKPLLPFINVRPYNVYEDAKNIISLEQITEIDSNDDLVHKADAFRFIILAKFGGIYFDLDMMFLKSFEPLIGDEFCYAWEHEPYANSAILSLAKDSKIAKCLLEKSNRVKRYHPTYTFMYSDKKLANLLVYPCTYFDPVWMPINSLANSVPFTSFDYFFKEFNGEFQKKEDINSYKHFFSGCFTYHWHNQWNTRVFENSYFGFFEKEYESLLKNRFLDENVTI